jgi:hypothetical protein
LYPTNLGAPSFDLPNVGLVKNESSKKMIDVFEQEKREIISKIEKLYQEYSDSVMVWESKISFEPIVGHNYFLYNFNGINTLSLISPEQWDKKDSFIGEFVLTYKHKINLQNNWEITLKVMGIDTIGQQELLSQEEFINKCKTDTEFSERWGLKIEERELSLEERLEIADKFNPLIREDCLTKTHHPDETEELKLIYRHEWLDSLGPNVVPQRKLITVTYNNKTIESYE